MIDGATNAILATANAGDTPISVAVNPNTNRIYVHNTGSGDVSVINGINNVVLASVHVDDMLDSGCGVAVNPSTNYVYVPNTSGDDLLVIDGNSNAVMAMISVGSGPVDSAVNPINNRVYVFTRSNKTISTVDGVSNTIIDALKAGSSNSNALAVNPNTNRIYLANGSSYTVSVIDAVAKNVIANVPVGNYPQGIAFNPNTDRIYVANSWSNTVSVINGLSNVVVATVDVGNYPQGIAVNPNTNSIYVANWFGQTVSVIDGISNTVVATLNVDTDSDVNAIAVNPNTNRIYVAGGASAAVSVINGSLNTVVATVPVGGSVNGVALNSSTNRIYAITQGNTFSVIDGVNNIVVATINNCSGSLAVNPVTNRVYVANYLNDTVTVIQDGPSASLPALTSLVPDNGGQGQTLAGVIINGTNLSGTTAITFSGTGVTASNLMVNSSGTQITATVTISADAALGARDVMAPTTLGTSGVAINGFTVTTPSSYSPYPFGYKFKNAGVNLTLADYNKEWAIFSNTFDLTNVDLQTKIAAFALIQFNDVFGPSGKCFGMSSSSLVEYMERANNISDQFLGNQGKDFLWDLDPHLVGNLLDASLSEPLVDHLLSYQMMSCAIIPKTSPELINTENVLTTLKTNGPSTQYVLNISGPYNGKIEGHALVPYLFKTISEGQKYELDVYDPNHPYVTTNTQDSVCPVIFENKSNQWTWTYDLRFNDSKGKDVIWSGASSDNSIFLTPVSAIYNGGNLLRLPTTNKTPEALIWLKGIANILLSDQSGNTAGYVNGSLTQNIPNMRVVLPEAVLPDSPPQTVNPSFYTAGDIPLHYKIESADGSVEGYQLSKIGTGYFVDVDSKVGPQPCKITINNDGSTISITGESSDYNLVLHKSVDSTDGLTFQATQIPASASNICQFSVDWNALAQGKQGVTVQLDTNGDGVFEKSFTSGSQLSAAEYISKTQAASSDATLSNLAISSGTLTPAFASGTTSYTDSVGNGVSSVTVTPTVNQANATLTVNGTPVTSGTPSGAITLAVGPNTINVAITAQDTTTVKTYSIVVTRAAPLSSDATLSNLAISSGTLTPAFASGTTGYTDSVGNAVSSVTVTPTVNQANATVTVNGTLVISGAPSGSITLAVGPNTINVAVTAQDTTTVKMYSIVVTRPALPSEGKPTRTFLGTYPNPSDYGKPARLIVMVLGIGSYNTPEVFFHNGELDPDILTQRSRDNMSIPTGTVVFKDGPTIIGTVNLDKMGTAILNCSSFSVGKHSITAEYSGNTNYNSSTSSVVTQTVKYNTSTKITSSINPSIIGQSVTFTSTISNSSGTPTGTVTFKDWDTTIARNIPLVGNKATFNASSLPAGIHNISATYNGDDSFASSSDNLNQMIKKASSTSKIISSLNPSNRGQLIIFTTTVSAVSPAIGIPSGRVIFKDGNTTIGEGIIDMAGIAKYSTSFLPKGMHNITATYIGDFNFNGSDSPGITQTVK